MNKDQQSGSGMAGDQPVGSGMPMPGSGQSDATSVPGTGMDQPMGGTDQAGMPTPAATPGDMPMPGAAGSGDDSGEKPVNPPHDPMDALDPHPDASQSEDSQQQAA